MGEIFSRRFFPGSSPDFFFPPVPKEFRDFLTFELHLFPASFRLQFFKNTLHKITGSWNLTIFSTGGKLIRFHKINAKRFINDTGGNGTLRVISSKKLYIWRLKILKRFWKIKYASKGWKAKFLQKPWNRNEFSLNWLVYSKIDPFVRYHFLFPSYVRIQQHNISNYSGH